MLLISSFKLAATLIRAWDWCCRSKLVWDWGVIFLLLLVISRNPAQELKCATANMVGSVALFVISSRKRNHFVTVGLTTYLSLCVFKKLLYFRFFLWKDRLSCRDILLWGWCLFLYACKEYANLFSFAVNILCHAKQNFIIFFSLYIEPSSVVVIDKSVYTQFSHIIKWLQVLHHEEKFMLYFTLN